MLVSPSILSADFLHLADELRSIESAGADWLHVDVMDGHFVPNLTFGLPVIKQMKSIVTKPLDVHIMVSNPDEVAAGYVDAGADLLTFHIEPANDPVALAKFIKSKGARAGVSLRPATPVETLERVLPHVDLVLVMSVNPGFGGQSFMGDAPDRVKRISAMATRLGIREKLKISVDGGINATTGVLVGASGADVLVAGSSVFGATDRVAAIASLKAIKTSLA
ncbi:ribulose-phosphate 3-epimerase [bacterium]|nr:ribulose-phosphate 3-epimerase [bacterium]